MIDNTDDKHVSGLYSLRFILAIIVMQKHVSNDFLDSLKASDIPLAKLAALSIAHAFCGVAAVIAFFIISGFIIHYYHRKSQDIHIISFWITRIIRISIPLIFVSGIAYYLGLFHTLPVWSLYCELIYYFIYPFLLKNKVSWNIKLIISFALSFLVILICAQGDVMSAFTKNHTCYIGNYQQLGPWFTSIVGLPCWLLGVKLASEIDAFHCNVSGRKIWTYRLIALAGGAVVLHARFHMHISYLLTLNILALYLYHWIKNEILYYKSHQPSSLFEKLGKFSYSLYLCHMLFYGLFEKILPVTSINYILLLSCIMFGSYIAYIIIELPAHRFAKRIAKNFS